MKVVTIVGARPQFIKAAALSHVLRRQATEILVHTGQHYDESMSTVFFDELDIPPPDYNLEVGSGTHGAQTGAMLTKIEAVLLCEQPDWVLIYGDTNSTVAGALAAAKLHIRVAHVEAGLRSYNRVMPEEINRVVADHLSDLLFCPSQVAAEQLAREGITRGVHVVGDVMADILYRTLSRAQLKSDVLRRLSLIPKAYLLATIHRAENTDNPARLAAILTAFSDISETVLFPVHPRTRKAIADLGMIPAKNLQLIDPVGYMDMTWLVRNSRLVVTDSGGLQKEAYWLGIPCVTVRDETEWVETVQVGWNVITGADRQRIASAVCHMKVPEARPELYGSGNAAEVCVSFLSH
ncbi:non-hydrolyzing UDP-N-acetylglucosamine 2-epimerase [Desulforhabdus sp. TSK]|uniref:non-hydrolyzing UDP-N-acetylglucosamine 2-epimerase n=1 Tax=Desulforhabdus sp. TSK TaxID=2925014 RepID=UPI001FC87695|nr:UDP-N-acetylglucosamine 2-epimerase (non-hydrolyzing) [Desulforhabdus sp. TSK]GKT10882.1 UDP-N-acetyl glucosamine 2-epimerase [Desulforhabdus sp. TSK]